MPRRLHRSSIIGIATGAAQLCFGLSLFSVPMARADVYAFRDATGHTRWTNILPVTSGLDEDPVAVVPTSSPPSVSRALHPASQKNVPSERMARSLSSVLSAAKRYDLDPALLLALIEVESSFDTAAVSSKGARGLMQLLPATARRYGLQQTRDLHDPAINVDLGARHLSDLLSAHQGNLAMALASYNAGQTAVKRHGGAIPAFRETMLYVPAILSRMQAYREMAPLERPHGF